FTPPRSCSSACSSNSLTILLSMMPPELDWHPSASRVPLPVQFFERDPPMDENDLQALSAQGVVKSFPKNAIVVSEGDDTDAFYVILAGKVKVFVSDEDGKEAVLRLQGPGEYFGEMVLDGGPRSASVMTIEP